MDAYVISLAELIKLIVITVTFLISVYACSSYLYSYYAKQENILLITILSIFIAAPVFFLVYVGFGLIEAWIAILAILAITVLAISKPAKEEEKIEPPISPQETPETNQTTVP